ncbi:MAG: UvrD-helicase domain-containing protein [Clostridia bacterium]|nr:UvrD-helicase domain-containing protein [Clostridia bacterium]
MPGLKEEYIRAKKQLFDHYYRFLNQPQREAVYTLFNPLLILAGAGSGKTTVLVNRIAHMIRFGDAYACDHVPENLSQADVDALKNAASLPDEEIEPILASMAVNPCPPWRILSITFTNKAANEMKTRLTNRIGEDAGAADIWAGTFHSICGRILRRHAELLGYAQNFVIYDQEDSKKAISTVIKDLDLDESMLQSKAVLSEISHAKDSLIDPLEYLDAVGKDYRLKQIGLIYQEYQKRLRASNAMDFDDMIVQTVTLFRKYPDILSQYQNRFLFVCVDEFQDTNKAQLALTVQLSGGFRNLMVVGDDDQSIYRFRGATIENILTFDKLFPDAKIIKLEQNYRSTKNILQAANEIIKHNQGRHEKRLWTDKGPGSPIHLKEVSDQNAEAMFIVDTIQKGVLRQGRQYKDYAVLYRMNAQSNSIEKGLSRYSIPYRILGGTRFSDRKEIRDAMAYLSLIANHSDNERLQRIINEPKRKIGEKTLTIVHEIALETGQSDFAVMEQSGGYVALSRVSDKLIEFTNMINRLSALAEESSLEMVYEQMLKDTGYRMMLLMGGQEEKERLENLEELKSNIAEYTQNADDPSLNGFLEMSALVADVDKYDESADAVVLMTIHSAKGLEFPIVFLPGMDENVFPSYQAIAYDPSQMEEERRLAYVAVTRAREELYLIHSESRLLFGSTQYNPLSRFAGDIPEEILDEEEKETKDFFSFQSRPIRATEIRKNGPVRSKSMAGESFRTPMEVPKPGASVTHPVFGDGRVISVSKVPADYICEVVFDRVGTKKLLLSKAKLQIKES